jgi:DNA helicase HerA-like ATPase
MAGTLGSGKTITAELVCFGAERRGSSVVNVDPKPDHALDQVPELEGRVDVIELTGEERYRGLLDPLRIAPASLREERTTTYLMDLLPRSSDPAWETQIRRAVREVIGADGRSSLDVLEALARSESPEARKAADALEVWCDSGLGRLAFADGGRQAIEVEHAVTTIRANGLTLPSPEASPHDYDSGERLSVATLKLVANYAMRLASDPGRHSVVLFDEAWALLSTTDGRRLARLGRSQNATLILATQQLGDVGELEGLVGTRLMFGLETMREAKAALELLGLDRVLAGLSGEVGGLAEHRPGLAPAHAVDALIAAYTGWLHPRGLEPPPPGYNVAAGWIWAPSITEAAPRAAAA